METPMTREKDEEKAREIVTRHARQWGSPSARGEAQLMCDIEDALTEARRAALEAAAKVAEHGPATNPYTGDRKFYGAGIAADIRALVPQDRPKETEPHEAMAAFKQWAGGLIERHDPSCQGGDRRAILSTLTKGD